MKQQLHDEALANLVKHIPGSINLDENMARQLDGVGHVREVWAEVLYRERESRGLSSALEALDPGDVDQQLENLETALMQAAEERLEMVSA